MRWPCVAVSGRRRVREPSRGPEARVSMSLARPPLQDAPRWRWPARIAGMLFWVRWPCVAVSGRRAREPSSLSRGSRQRSLARPRYRMRRWRWPARIAGCCFGCVGPVSGERQAGV